MRRLFLFAIGGTGARVVRSLTMMLASGIDGIDSSTEIVPIILDYDLSNGDKTKAINALKWYSKIHDSLYPDAAAGALYNDHFFMTRLRSLKDTGAVAPPVGLVDFEFNFGPAGNSVKFGDHLELAKMNTFPDLRLTQSLMHALYDESPETSKDAELELDMTKGFKGNPNIGTVVFHDLKTSPEFRQFKTTFDAAQDRVFIISSIFGGTGASGFPEIVNAIRTNDTLKSAVIGTALVLPYFKLKPFDPGKGDVGAIDAATFNAKTRAALSYYATPGGINDKVNALYYIGDKNHDNYDYHEGAASQKNNAHVVEFVAATAILHFIKEEASITLAGHDAYEMGILDDRIATCIQQPDFPQSVQDLVLDRLSTFAVAMKFYRDVVCGDRQPENPSTAYFSDFGLHGKRGHGVYALLDEFLLNANLADEADRWGFYHWIEELTAHNHKLSLYRMSLTQGMDKVLSYKDMPNGTFNHPFRDNQFSSALNHKSKAATHDDTNFLKILRDVAKEKYTNNK